MLKISIGINVILAAMLVIALLAGIASVQENHALNVDLDTSYESCEGMLATDRDMLAENRETIGTLLVLNGQLLDSKTELLVSYGALLRDYQKLQAICTP